MAAREFAARLSGATEGVTRSGEQTVFASSVAKDSTTGKSQAAAGRSSDAASSDAASPSTRSATSDVWSGYAARGSSSLSTADLAAVPQTGPSSQTIGIAALGLGLVGLVGGFLVAGLRRQRVPADRSSGRNER